MSQTPATRASYQSAHYGAVTNADGQFDHFARQLDEAHLKNGYWRFTTYKDERRAYECGFGKPEDVLIAQDVGDGVYDDLSLRWVPGKSDPTNTKPSVGTASAHLETIYSERKLLGLCLAFKGRVPVYPISDDQRLVNYRLMRYGIQRVALPDTTLLSPSRHGPRKPETSASPLHKERSPSRRPDLASVAAPTLCIPHADNGTASALEALVPALLMPGETPTSSASPKPAEESSTTEQLNRKNNLQSQLCIEPRRQTTPLPHLSSLEYVHRESSDMSSPLLKTGPDGLEQQDYVNVMDKIHASHTYPNGLIEDVSILSLADTSSSELGDMKSALLPCVDCGAVGFHELQCWISKATPSSQPIEGLSVAELEKLVESVNRFDPGPWTTHAGTPPELVDDPKTQLQGMADVIRNLDISAEYSELHGLDDRLMVLTWGLRFSGDVEMRDV